MLDNLDPYYNLAIKRANLESLASRARDTGATLRVFNADVCDPAAVDEALASIDATGVIHLAGKAGVRPSIADPTGYTRANVLGTAVVLERASAGNIKRAVCASSSSVYGNAERVPFSEEDPAIKPISPYAATKRSAELLAAAHHHLTQMPVAMLRFFTVFGPRQRPDLAINLFLRKIAAGDPISVFGDGTMSRDFTYVDDIVAGVLAAYTRIDQFGLRTWNLGGDDPHTLAELIETVAAVVGREPVIDRKPMQPGDVNRTWADLTRSRAELGYAPKTTLRTGMEQQWAWMQAQAAAAS